MTSEGKAVVAGESEIDCNETIYRLYTYLDGELTEDRRQEIKHHLDKCRDCVEAFDFEAELRAVIAQRCKDHVPDTLRERVRDSLVEEERKQQNTRG
jgi:mycothiol system anti-sigma-R factor